MALAEEDIIVFLPGILGTELTFENGATWGGGASTIWSGLLDSGSDLVAGLKQKAVVKGPIRSLSIVPGLFKVQQYGSFEKSLEREFSRKLGSGFYSFGYDWRRDNRDTAKLLKDFITQRLIERREATGKSGKVVIIAHSMGGLVAAWYLFVLGGGDTLRAFIPIGTPFAGSLNAFRLLHEGTKSVYAKSVRFTPIVPDWDSADAVMRNMQSLYQLLPTYPCFKAGDELLPLKDVNDFDFLTDYFLDSVDFHTELHSKTKEASLPEATVKACLGIGRSTLMQVSPSEAENRYETHLEGAIRNDGDGTVPFSSALRLDAIPAQANHFSAFGHGGLQTDPEVQLQISATVAVSYGAATQFRTGLDLNDLSLISSDEFYSTDDDIVLNTVSKNRSSAVSCRVERLIDGQKMVPDIPIIAGKNKVKVPALEAGEYSVSLYDGNKLSSSDVFCVV